MSNVGEREREREREKKTSMLKVMYRENVSLQVLC